MTRAFLKGDHLNESPCVINHGEIRMGCDTETFNKM